MLTQQGLAPELEFFKRRRQERQAIYSIKRGGYDLHLQVVCQAEQNISSWQLPDLRQHFSVAQYSGIQSAQKSVLNEAKTVQKLGSARRSQLGRAACCANVSTSLLGGH